MAEKKHVSKEKIESVKRIANDMRNKKSLMIVSIKGLPSSQLQKIKKDLREKAMIRVAKKSTIIRAIEESGLEELQKLKEHVIEDSAILFSDDDAFELAGWLTENRNPISAKEGQVAESDIVIEEGPTDLVPGPVISELGALGLQIMVEEGKITIRKSKVAVKKGDKVSSGAASIFQKLGIKPFMIGISPIALYDKSSGKVFANVKVDKKKTLEDFMASYSKAIGFARAINYYSKETIGYLLERAERQANSLNKLKSLEVK